MIHESSCNMYLYTYITYTTKKFGCVDPNEVPSNPLVSKKRAHFGFGRAAMRLLTSIPGIGQSTVDESCQPTKNGIETNHPKIRKKNQRFFFPENTSSPKFHVDSSPNAGLCEVCRPHKGRDISPKSTSLGA